VLGHEPHENLIFGFVGYFVLGCLKKEFISLLIRNLAYTKVNHKINKG
jgi:hypothetical protein